MACLVIGDGIRIGETIVPGQLFAFGGIILHATSVGHLDQVNNFAPQHQIRFGNLEYVTDARGDLIFNGFLALPETPENPEDLTSDSLSDPIPGSVLTLGLAFFQDTTTTSKDQESTWLDLPPTPRRRLTPKKSRTQIRLVSPC